MYLVDFLLAPTLVDFLRSVVVSKSEIVDSEKYLVSTTKI